MVDACDRDGSELLFNIWYREGGCGGELNDGKMGCVRILSASFNHDNIAY